MDNEVLLKLKELEQRIAFLEEEITTIKKIDQSEKVKEYIESTERTKKIAKLLDASSDKEELYEKVSMSADNEIAEKFSDISSISDMETAKKFVDDVDRDLKEKIETQEALSNQYDWSRIFEYSIHNGCIRIDSYLGFDEKSITIPKKIDGMFVTEIGDSVFENCKSLNVVALPNSIVKIGKRAFSNSDLTKINLSEGIVEIGEGAFGYSKLREIHIPSTLNEIKKDTFRMCSNLINVVILQGVKGIGDQAFDECEKLSKIDIPKGVIHIGNYVFHKMGSSGEKDIHIRIPDSVEKIEQYNFGGYYNVFIAMREVML